MVKGVLYSFSSYNGNNINKYLNFSSLWLGSQIKDGHFYLPLRTHRLFCRFWFVYVNNARAVWEVKKHSQIKNCASLWFFLICGFTAFGRLGGYALMLVWISWTDLRKNWVHLGPNFTLFSPKECVWLPKNNLSHFASSVQWWSRVSVSCCKML